MSPRWLHWPAAAAGPSLIIHDAFSGSGSPSGRTPDTVDNGNTWTIVEGDWTVTSGYLRPQSAPNRLVIDAAATPRQITVTTQASTSGTNVRHGIVFNYDATSTAYEMLYFRSSTSLYHSLHNGSGIFTESQVDTFPAISASTDLDWVIDVSSSSVDWSISTGGSEFSSGSVSPTYSGTSVGCWSRYAPNENRFFNFKVYS